MPLEATLKETVEEYAKDLSVLAYSLYQIYSDLKQNYVIFICTFDPFHKGKPFYTFQNYCINYDKPIPLGDGTEKIFLNTAAKDLSNLDQKLQALYHYLQKYLFFRGS